MGRAKPDEVGNAVDQHGGLAAAGTGQDEQRAVGGEHRPPLHLVQAAELLFDIGVAQSAEFLCQICCHGFPCLLLLSKNSIPHFQEIENSRCDCRRHLRGNFAAHFLRRGSAAGAAPGRLRNCFYRQAGRMLAATGPHGFSTVVKQVIKSKFNILPTLFY